MLFRLKPAGLVFKFPPWDHSRTRLPGDRLIVRSLTRPQILLAGWESISWHNEQWLSRQDLVTCGRWAINKKDSWN